MKFTLAAGLFVTASALAFAQAPAGSSATQSTTSQPRQGSSRSAAPAGERTLTGCLTSADNIYTLTVMDDSGAPGTTAETIAYTLAPGTGVDLSAHLNKRVTVKGTDAGPDAASSNRIVMNTPAAPAATGTSGNAGAKPTDTNAATGGATRNSGNASSGSGATPTVETTAKTRITQRTFNVSNVQPATGNCGA